MAEEDVQMKNQSSKTMLDPSTELKLRASLSFAETIDLSEETDNRLIRSWLALPEEKAKAMDQAEFDKDFRPQIRQQVLLEMIAAKEGGKNGG